MCGLSFLHFEVIFSYFSDFFRILADFWKTDLHGNVQNETGGGLICYNYVANKYLWRYV